MTDLERRHRKATDKIALWTGAANNARAMGDDAVSCDGRTLLGGPEGALRRADVLSHGPGCRCESCVTAWEEGADIVERVARLAGVDLRRHSFGALRRMERERGG